MNETEPAGPEPPETVDETRELARKGAVVLALLVAAGALLVAFQAVTSVINTWLQDRWVPVWRAVFALLVVGLAVWVLKRLTADSNAGGWF